MNVGRKDLGQQINMVFICHVFSIESTKSEQIHPDIWDYMTVPGLMFDLFFFLSASPAEIAAFFIWHFEMDMTSLHVYWLLMHRG